MLDGTRMVGDPIEERIYALFGGHLENWAASKTAGKRSIAIPTTGDIGSCPIRKARCTAEAQLVSQRFRWPMQEIDTRRQDSRTRKRPRLGWSNWQTQSGDPATRDCSRGDFVQLHLSIGGSSLVRRGRLISPSTLPFKLT
jgi:hypothetical protein